MPSTTRPKLGKLSTPVSSTFPSEITSATTATPVSAVAMYIKQEPAEYIKTPISPPPAYTDFLTKAMPFSSPSVSTPTTATTSAPVPASAAAIAAASGEITPDSVPSTANSEKSDTSSRAGEGPSPASSTTSVNSIASNKRSPPATAACVPPSPYSASATAAARGPLSAPPTGPATFPSLRLPPSPAISHLDSPHSARSPFSARSLNSSSVFDWDAALKARFAEQRKQKSSRTSVRHIREVVTRTVTYTPKMEPAPKGKRRKLE
ncbi:hypothetical protein NLU13_2268 [Sarocladium strictum]|uniref:Uncharacterized protein n=1 Tax=Sarocladium strictum TaxID=5046 RepID=A0AA39GU17_SARSR|nr:hypothetical protein NLU13_2268 [Sarocladium strictum]